MRRLCGSHLASCDMSVESAIAPLHRAQSLGVLYGRRELIKLGCEGIPITDSHFWQNEEEFTLDVLRHVFRSTTDEEIPLLEERLAVLREAGTVLYEVSPIITEFWSWASNQQSPEIQLPPIQPHHRRQRLGRPPGQLAGPRLPVLPG